MDRLAALEQIKSISGFVIELDELISIALSSMKEIANTLGL